MTFEEWLGDRIEIMSSHEYAAEKAAWEAGELCGYNRGREHNETDLEVVRNAGIQEGIERMQKAYQIRPRGKSIIGICPECILVEGKHKLDCSYGRE